MAIQKSKVPFIGRRGNLVGYWSRGKALIRTVGTLDKEQFYKNPNFEEAQKNADRMARAARLSSLVYNTLSKEKRLHKFYQKLKVHAYQCLRAGNSEEMVVVELNRMSSL